MNADAWKKTNIGFNIELVKRNFRWIAKIDEYHSTLEGPVLIAVGKGHLYSSIGILSLLKRYGFEIMQITLSGHLCPYENQFALRYSLFMDSIEWKVHNHILKIQEIIENQTSLGTWNSNLIRQYLISNLHEDPSTLSYHLDLKENEINNDNKERKIDVNISHEKIQPKLIKRR